MLKHERILGTSRAFLRLAALAIKGKIGLEGKEPPSITNTFFIKAYSRFLELGPKESERIGVNRIVLEVIDYWFWADSYLDSQPPGSSFKLEEIHHKGVSDKHRFQKVENTINGSGLSQETKEDLGKLVVGYKKEAIHAHSNFIHDFKPSKTSYDSVLNYRQQTSGDMVEMIIRVIGISAGAKDEDIEKIIGVARNEILGLQMADDMVDSVSDFGQLPNLFNALLIEEPNEMQQFSGAISSNDVIHSMKPYQIADSFSPETLAEYIHRFKKMIGELPEARRNLMHQFMAVASYCSYTPGEGKPTNRSSVFSRGTII